MEQIHVREELAAPVETVWKLLRDFADVSAWARGRVVRVEGAGPGMLRHIDGPSGRFVERLESHDDATHTFSYRLVETPMPVSSYIATVRLTAAGAERTVIEWSADFTAKEPAAGPTIRQAIETVYRDTFIGKLRDKLATPPQSR